MQSPKRFYYTWRLLFLHHSFAWCVFILLKRSFSPGRTGGFHQLLNNKKETVTKTVTVSFWQGQKDFFSPAGSVGASKHLRCLEVSTGDPHPSTRSACLVFRTVCTNEKEKRAVKRLFFFLAGAEGLEPSARGFGDRCSTN